MTYSLQCLGPTLAARRPYRSEALAGRDVGIVGSFLVRHDESSRASAEVVVRWLFVVRGQARRSEEQESFVSGR